MRERCWFAAREELVRCVRGVGSLRERCWFAAREELVRCVRGVGSLRECFYLLRIVLLRIFFTAVALST
jgi:hypothetical protein